MNEIVAEVYYSEKLEDYAPFHDPTLHKQLASKFPSPIFLNAVRKMTLLWDGASLVRSMPWYMVKNVTSAANAAASYNEPLSLKTLSTLHRMLVKNVTIGGLELGQLEKSALKYALGDAESAAREVLKTDKVLLSVEEAWSAFLQERVIRYSLWHSELQAFCQVYFAYENFLVSITGQVLELPSNARKQAVGKAIQKTFGLEVFDKIWDDEFITFARLVRNAVTHNGAHITRDLESYREWVKVDVQGLISIGTNQTNHLYNLLMQKVEYYLGVLDDYNKNS